MSMCNMAINHILLHEIIARICNKPSILLYKDTYVMYWSILKIDANVMQ